MAVVEQSQPMTHPFHQAKASRRKLLEPGMVEIQA